MVGRRKRKKKKKGKRSRRKKQKKEIKMAPYFNEFFKKVTIFLKKLTSSFHLFNNCAVVTCRNEKKRSQLRIC